MILFLYLIILVFGFIIPLLFAIYGVFCIIVDFTGAPYVPTSQKILEEILEGAKLKKGQQWLELGSGDGRATRLAVRRYGVAGTGIDIHIPLIFYSRLLARLQNLKNIHFRIQNLFSTDLRNYDVIFMFLLPVTLKKLCAKLEKECSKGTLVISHGFRILGFEKYLVIVQKRKLFPTYFYKL
ncbi:hypothetical protein A2631_03860 [Candidatus Daviesbacteria bacterium RIFCSPHIGHO2_01_FULL_44_29]|uniref:Methyltransferase domain-containing protein n=1 Tax=Candidatus Daviesbacteria bacterium RIFCSPHIGHO2_02_FULL_43_12 TaxID=1797776 RepID=A0A1F5KG69_9BACT|nr:MAG: hypothetical protein A2631_03860 [Candidatus Daviesbacteria bacterium RIFCSPHIGHO2_01_FULL_44_29]OGE39864.1 MAG: hypothetical protein A3E86_01125 [Candidatus Daviesbacteria bacterium RIFCSPHIGHO2_12_FULL_47_45]OGE39868.1 MAG: hypothetical protein A3D25_03590 [Candidatus Daviesbacteria bacterium RIFCSPHIGHO2_02_FULL_43_12]OGE70451.1 MAG: hypothetical protein A3B55_01980 [Candidatus Daviesbacteria bacterium RIFCSPLOWO2_01_FULL_43_15]